MSTIVITILVLILMFLVTLVLYVGARKKIKVINSDLKQSREMCEGLMKELEKLRKIDRIKTSNEEKANEKINDLYTGKLSADDILPK